MPQHKHERCLTCRFSEFGDGKQKDDNTGEPIGRCCYAPPSVVVVHFQEPPKVDARIIGSRGPGKDLMIDDQVRPGAIHEIVTGAQPVVKASFWCAKWEKAP
jgi:hypothetical protein